MKLQSFTLQIFDPKQTLPFYIDVLGYTLLKEATIDDSTYFDLGFKNTNFFIQLKYTPQLEKRVYQEAAIHNYWKYSLFVDDIQKAYRNVQKHNFPIGEPYQFDDIGYLSHTEDTEHHKVEYIQKTFRQNTPVQTEEPTALGLLTIRTKDPVKTIKLYEDILGMKLFVRMYVNRGKGFTLYFLGDQDLEAPNPDIDAIENREWMYQQSHLFIEIQHYWNSEQDDNFVLEVTDKNGLQTINFLGNLNTVKQRLVANNILFHQEKDQILFKTIDNHTILVKAEYTNGHKNRDLNA
ncbi:hypothetical protein M0D21_08130 [Aquimarina sp. D1M17]|uniref:VOC family protein n=1 Tax=Aquimarina acroporae TaxID=2937283 RepID=UPI0020BECA6A|nr:VOC family protein [Aquimarina acroporae]MCK8521532.1 hypothetical protein [Aquimarina acroporae]